MVANHRHGIVDMDHTLFVRLTEFVAAQPDDRTELARLVAGGQATLAAHPDCIRCETCLDAEDPRKVVAIEIWSDRESRKSAALAIPSELVRAAVAIMRCEPEARDLTIPDDFPPDAGRECPAGSS